MPSTLKKAECVERVVYFLNERGFITISQIENLCRLTLAEADDVARETFHCKLVERQRHNNSGKGKSAFYLEPLDHQLSRTEAMEKLPCGIRRERFPLCDHGHQCYLGYKCKAAIALNETRDPAVQRKLLRPFRCFAGSDPKMRY